MEMLDGNRRLIRGMEEDGCSCGGEAGYHRQNTLVQILRQKERRLQRMAPFLAAALFLLVSVALALLILVVLGGRGHQSPGSQPMTSDLSDANAGQQKVKDDKNPSAMLTVPGGNNTDGEYLKWESKSGNAFCQGGFKYSGGNLIVPRNGIYRVFLQITYESKDDIDCRSDELRLTNVISLYQDSYTMNIPLLSSVDTVSCSMEQWSKSLYTAGLFSLEANGRLRVTSSHPDLIVGQEHQVFFGAELLPQ